MSEPATNEQIAAWKHEARVLPHRLISDRMGALIARIEQQQAEIESMRAADEEREGVMTQKAGEMMRLREALEKAPCTCFNKWKKPCDRCAALGKGE